MAKLIFSICRGVVERIMIHAFFMCMQTRDKSDSVYGLNC